MAKVSFTSLNLKVNKDVNTFTFNGKEIEVLKYLPIMDKYDTIMIALQKAKEDEIYNELKLDMYFHLYLVYMYTNLSFTEKQKEDEAKLYDALKSSGFMDAFLAVMDENEYEELWTMMGVVKEDLLQYNTTAAAIVQRLIVDLPKNAEAAAAIVENFNPEQYERVVNFANAAGLRE